MDMRPNVVVSSGSGVVMKLPIGFRFRPTDQELLLHYLKPKVHSSPLPASVIPDFHHVSQINPWDLPGDSKEKIRYFFSKRRSSEDVMKYKSNRVSSGCGYWKAIGKEKQIVISKDVHPASLALVVVGLKKTLHFYHAVAAGNHPIPTNWVMQEYRLHLPPHSNHHSSQGLTMEDWVVCRIYQKKRKAKNHGLKTGRGSMKEDSSRRTSDRLHQPSSSSSTCSSGITHVSSNGSLHHHNDQEEEEASSFN